MPDLSRPQSGCRHSRAWDTPGRAVAHERAQGVLPAAAAHARRLLLRARVAAHAHVLLPHPAQHLDTGGGDDGARAPGLQRALPRGAHARRHHGPQGALHGPLALRLRRPLRHPHEQGARLHPHLHRPRHLRLPHQQGEHGAARGAGPCAGVGHPQRRRHRRLHPRPRRARGAGRCCCVRHAAGVPQGRGPARRRHPRGVPAAGPRALHNRGGRPYARRPRADARAPPAPGPGGDAGARAAAGGAGGSAAGAGVPQRVADGGLLHRHPRGRGLRPARRHDARGRRPRGPA
mmetsp:Transcript_7988/g.24019  ORF Transcript_7988/g.24019 Transcript_7988/m.24019 type:complete len:290 (+) Transcript_7988:322-1191(+)